MIHIWINHVFWGQINDDTLVIGGDRFSKIVIINHAATVCSLPSMRAKNAVDVNR